MMGATPETCRVAYGNVINSALRSRISIVCVSEQTAIISRNRINRLSFDQPRGLVVRVSDY